ncbi:hypothetical protein FVEG_16672 [Fusarium verticillioides 7600]|uniref:Uncharacterized protein n=1 Tax=Gibberella moniliformis (strain M3125 / FGSC 7600) TaxID=334819 RepID=W7N1Q0_GIBM7|nr:hypothetical protein FVEG_16672 [Fusarium verticillioides 7600]EWG50662.1 hypothetical protein FVEG_16672 [Fusarium verticillioides 7600]
MDTAVKDEEMDDDDGAVVKDEEMDGGCSKRQFDKRVPPPDMVHFASPF